MRGRPFQLRVEGAEGAMLVAVVAIGAVAAGFAGAVALPGGFAEPLTDRFGSGELVAWSVIALVTGGLSIGARDRNPPVIPGALVGSAALLGASPVACATIGVAGALGGMRHQRGMLAARVAAAALMSWAVPGLLALAAGAGGVELGDKHPLPLASVLMLWAVLALVLPLVESAGTAIALEPSERINAAHMVQRRFEPHSVLTALAVLAAISYAAIGPVAGLVVLLPAAAARVGFALHDDGRRAVSQTLAAMTALPEWVGLVDVGHTARVRETVEQVALELELESRLRHDVVRAAELHELGHLDTGADRDDRGRVARSGAAVLAQAEIRERVEQIVHATDPDRPVHARDGDVELGAAIVSTACELDRREKVDDAADAARRVALAIGKAHRSAGAYL